MRGFHGCRADSWGDSIAEHWDPALQEIFRNLGWRFVPITKSGCPMVVAPLFDSDLGRVYTECKRWRREALRKIAALRPDVVVITSLYSDGFTRHQWISGTQKVLRSLATSTGQIYVIRSVPVVSFDGTSCMEPRGWLYGVLVTKSHCTSAPHTRLDVHVYRWLKQAAATFADVHLIDMTPSICPQGLCRAELDGKKVFVDDRHLTAAFARSLAPQLRKALELDALSSPAVDGQKQSHARTMPRTH